jgi:hypothetical protein
MEAAEANRFLKASLRRYRDAEVAAAILGAYLFVLDIINL